MKTALVARLGVIGDQLIASSILPHLKAQGFHVTYLCYAPHGEVVQNNPHIDILRMVPHGTLGKSDAEFMAFWMQAPKLFDRVIHLSSTLESSLVFQVQQPQFWWEPVGRRAVAGRNYLEQTHAIAGVPMEFRPQFFPTDAEARWAEEFAGRAPTVGVVLSGSNFDKMHPRLHEIVAQLLVARQDLSVVLFGADIPRDHGLVQVCMKHVKACISEGASRVRHTIGQPIRRSLALAQQMHVMVGPDTGLMWGVAMEPVGKVVMLSHASPENITKHWTDTITLHADQAEVPCWPCHRLHQGAETCTVQKDSGAAACMASIDPGVVVRAALRQLDLRGT